MQWLREDTVFTELQKIKNIFDSERRSGAIYRKLPIRPEEVNTTNPNSNIPVLVEECSQIPIY